MRNQNGRCINQNTPNNGNNHGIFNFTRVMAFWHSLKKKKKENITLPFYSSSETDAFVPLSTGLTYQNFPVSFYWFSKHVNQKAKTVPLADDRPTFLTRPPCWVSWEQKLCFWTVSLAHTRIQCEACRAKSPETQHGRRVIRVYRPRRKTNTETTTVQNAPLKGVQKKSKFVSPSRL